MPKPLRHKGLGLEHFWAFQGHVPGVMFQRSTGEKIVNF